MSRLTPMSRLRSFITRTLGTPEGSASEARCRRRSISSGLSLLRALKRARSTARGALTSMTLRLGTWRCKSSIMLREPLAITWMPLAIASSKEAGKPYIRPWACQVMRKSPFASRARNSASEQLSWSSVCATALRVMTRRAKMNCPGGSKGCTPDNRLSLPAPLGPTTKKKLPVIAIPLGAVSTQSSSPMSTGGAAWVILLVEM